MGVLGLGFGGLGLRGLGFRGLGFRGLGFGVLGSMALKPERLEVWASYIGPSREILETLKGTCRVYCRYEGIPASGAHSRGPVFEH